MENEEIFEEIKTKILDGDIKFFDVCEELEMPLEDLVEILLDLDEEDSTINKELKNKLKQEIKTKNKIKTKKEENFEKEYQYNNFNYKELFLELILENYNLETLAKKYEIPLKVMKNKYGYFIKTRASEERVLIMFLKTYMDKKDKKGFIQSDEKKTMEEYLRKKYGELNYEFEEKHRKNVIEEPKQDNKNQILKDLLAGKITMDDVAKMQKYITNKKLTSRRGKEILKEVLIMILDGENINDLALSSGIDQYEIEEYYQEFLKEGKLKDEKLVKYLSEYKDNIEIEGFRQSEQKKAIDTYIKNNYLAPVQMQFRGRE